MSLYLILPRVDQLLLQNSREYGFRKNSGLCLRLALPPTRLALCSHYMHIPLAIWCQLVLFQIEWEGCIACTAFMRQPFKPPFKIYSSLGDTKRIKNLVVDTKTRDIKVISTLVKTMLERNVFLFGSVDANEGSATGRINELTEIQNARVQAAYKMLFAKTRLEQFIHMDLGRELDVDLIKKNGAEYAVAKELSIREATKAIDVQNVKHIAENKISIGETVEKIVEDWNFQKESFYQRTGFGYRSAAERSQNHEIEYFEQQSSNKNVNQNEVLENIDSREVNEKFEGQEPNDDFGIELEVLLSQHLESDNEETEDKEQWEEHEKLEEQRKTKRNFIRQNKDKDRASGKN